MGRVKDHELQQEPIVRVKDPPLLRCIELYLWTHGKANTKALATCSGLTEQEVGVVLRHLRAMIKNLEEVRGND